MKFIEARHDRWHTVGGEDGPVPQPDPAPNRLLTLEQWQAVRGLWPRTLPAGVQLANDADPAAIAADVAGPAARLALVVLHFPKWTDGRAYSQARLLRVRHGFRGELRAAGEVLVDMLPLLQRCGVDAVQLRHDQDMDAALRALGFFGGHYQGDRRDPRPLFARDRRAAAAAALADPLSFAGQGI
jgi:uncharacterized protein (DUF934 family)